MSRYIDTTFGPYSKLRTTNWPIARRKQTQPYNKVGYVKGRDKQFTAASSQRILTRTGQKWDAELLFILALQGTGANSILLATVPFTLAEKHVKGCKLEGSRREKHCTEPDVCEAKGGKTTGAEGRKLHKHDVCETKHPEQNLTE